MMLALALQLVLPLDHDFLHWYYFHRPCSRGVTFLLDCCSLHCCKLSNYYGERCPLSDRVIINSIRHQNQFRVDWHFFGNYDVNLFTLGCDQLDQPPLRTYDWWTFELHIDKSYLLLPDITSSLSRERETTHIQYRLSSAGSLKVMNVANRPYKLT